MARELTKMQSDFLDALFGEAKGDFRTAMSIAGYKEGTRIDQTILPIKDEIIERAREQLAIESPKAVVGIVSALEDPTQLGVQHKINAAKEILDRVGIARPEKDAAQVRVDNAIFVLPAKDPPIK